MCGLMELMGWRIEDRDSGFGDRGSRIEDRGSTIEDRLLAWNVTRFLLTHQVGRWGVGSIYIHMCFIFSCCASGGLAD